jgi:hypothetical protein
VRPGDIRVDGDGRKWVLVIVAPWRVAWMPLLTISWPTAAPAEEHAP